MKKSKSVKNQIASVKGKNDSSITNWDSHVVAKNEYNEPMNKLIDFNNNKWNGINQQINADSGCRISLT